MNDNNIFNNNIKPQDDNPINTNKEDNIFSNNESIKGEENNISNNPQSISYQENNVSINQETSHENNVTGPEEPIQVKNNEIPNNNEVNITQNSNTPNKKGSPLLIIIIVIFIVIIGAVVFVMTQLPHKTSTKKEESTINSDSSTQLTGFYAIDYDYNSLPEGGDGSDLELSHSYISEYYKISELPNAYWDDEKISQEEIVGNEYEESNERYRHQFVDSIHDYVIFNLDDSSSVKDAYEKGWYAIEDLKISNFSVKTNTQKEKFDSIIKGLGKPYCVIKSVNNYPSDDKGIYNDVFIIYQFGNSFYVLDYYDNKNKETKEENLDLLLSYWIASEDMLRAYIIDNMGSNNVDSYTQTYIYQNGKDLIKE